MDNHTLFHLLFFIIAAAAFVAAIFTNGTPRSSQLTNFGLASLTVGLAPW